MLGVACSGGEVVAPPSPPPIATPVPAEPKTTDATEPRGLRVLQRGHEAAFNLDTLGERIAIRGAHLEWRDRQGRFSFAALLQSVPPATTRCVDLVPGAPAVPFVFGMRDRGVFRVVVDGCDGKPVYIGEPVAIEGLDATTTCPAYPAAGPRRVTLDDATAIARDVAAAELCREEASHRVTDPDVTLRLADYRVDTSVEQESYRVWFEFKPKKDPPFMTWLGHPMHFAVVVRAADGTYRIAGGE
jgi:hypothetical protein